MYIAMVINTIMAKIQISEIIVEEYKLGKSINYLSKKYNYSNPTLMRRLKEIGLYQGDDSKKERYIINESYFEIINTPDKAYFLGLLYADGYSINNTVGIDLQESDKELLEKFNKYLESNKPLKTYPRKCINSQNRVRLIITRKKIAKDLEKLGLLSNKTHSICFPTEEQVPLKLQSHFIRGVFDGDGCISKGKRFYNASITGNKCLLEGIEKVLVNNTKIKKGYYTKRHKNKNDNIYTLNLSSNSYALKFFDFIYEDATIFLKRKFDKFQKLKEIKPKRIVA
jgi:hypothetical protein